MKPLLIIRKMSVSPEVSHRLWPQYLEFANGLTLRESEREQLGKAVLELINKLDAVQYHRNNIRRIVKEELRRLAESTEKGDVIKIDTKGKQVNAASWDDTTAIAATSRCRARIGASRTG